MNRLLIEDRPPYRSYRPTWRYRLCRFLLTSQIPFALWFPAVAIVAFVCLLSALLMVTR